MYRTTGQFDERSKKITNIKEQDYNAPRGISGSAPKEREHKSCPHCGGSGRAKPRPKAEQLQFPGMGGIRPKRPEDKDYVGPRKNDLNKHPQNIGRSGLRKEEHKPKDPKRYPKEHKDYESYIGKKKNTIKGKKKDDDDDNKGGAGGAKVPRKPKPSPKSPGEYRPIERRVDQDYARRQDRYRVTLAK